MIIEKKEKKKQYDDLALSFGNCDEHISVLFLPFID